MVTQSHVATDAEDPKSGREIVPDQPTVQRRPHVAGATWEKVVLPVSENVVYSQELHELHGAASAGATIMLDHNSFETKVVRPCFQVVRGVFFNPISFALAAPRTEFEARIFHRSTAVGSCA